MCCGYSSLPSKQGDSDFLEPPIEILRRDLDTESSFGDFEIIRELGRGGMGSVFLAQQQGLDRPVALKVFVEGLLTSDRQLERFHREARSVARLDHLGIVSVHASGSEGATHWFAMDFIAGHDLAREIELQLADIGPANDASRPFLPRPGEPSHPLAVARVGLQVAEALQFAHERGLVHRDVKPQNILLRKDGVALIADFGIARDEELGTLTRSGEIQGTPFYMSPEQARVTDEVIDHRTDVYSLGVVLYELASLCRPHAGSTHVEVLEALRSADPRPLRALDSRLPRDLEVICTRSLCKDPRNRYGTAGALADDLRRFLAKEPIAARPLSLFERCGRFLERRGGRVAAVAVTVVATLLAWYFTDRAATSALRAQLTVTGVVEPERVGLQRLDPITGGVSETQWFGRGPIRSRSVEAGYVRVVVGAPGALGRQFTRDLRAGEHVELRLPVGGASTSLDGMVRIEGGVVSTRDPGRGALTVALNYTDTPVDAFFLDSCEVSNVEYRLFLEETGTLPPDHWPDLIWPNDENLPVVGVSWFEARSFAEWAGKRLPSFAEWSWAARGPENRVYPWADPVVGELRGNVARPWNGTRTRVADYRQSAASVTSHPDARTSSGLWHMLGNVREWTETVAAMPKGEPQLLTLETRAFVPSPSARLVAGHAWRPALASGSHDDLTLPYVEFGRDRVRANLLTGFRCAVGVVP